MDVLKVSLMGQRYVLALVFFGSSLLVLPAAVEPFMLPKATIAVLGAVALAVLWSTRVVWLRQLSIPTGPIAVAAAALATALGIATVTSPAPWTSLVGFYARYTGLVPYVAYLVVFLVTVTLADLHLVRLLSRTAAASLACTAAYGIVQAAGLEPLSFKGQENLGTTFSFFGNVNFSAAWSAAVSALVLMIALSSQEKRGWRLFTAALLPLTLLYLVLTGTVQGVVVYLVALAFVAAATASDRSSRVRAVAIQRRRQVLGAAGVLTMAALAVLIVAFSALRTQLDKSLVERPDFWRTAVDLFAEHPVLGTGLDTYAHHFLANRPADHALLYGVATTDAPHSVPLGMLSNGGLVLGLAYFGFIAVVAFALVRGLRSLQGPERLALAGAGGAWLGYQVQSLVSLDVPPLALLHFMMSGLIVALTWQPRWHIVRLPGRPAVVARTRKGRGRVRLNVPASTRVWLGLIGVVGLTAMWFGLYPLRADLLAASAAPLTRAGQYGEAVERFRRAAGMNPAEASYSRLASQGLAAAGRPREALAAAAEAARRDPGTVQYALLAARTAQQLGDMQAAERWYRDAVARDPLDPPVLNEVAGFLFDVGDDAAARKLAQRSVDLRADPASQALLERVSAE